MDLTIQTLVRRARAYRMLVIAVVMVLLLTLVACLILGSVLPFAGSSYLLPACSLYFFWDSQLLTRWRRALLASWSATEIELGLLRQGLRMNNALPTGTLEGMLETLPAPCVPGIAETAMAGSTRAAIERTSNAIDACRNDLLRFNCIAHAVIAISVVTAVWQRSWLPLLASLTALSLALMRTAITHAPVSTLSKALKECRQGDGFDRESYLSTVEGLDWRPVSATAKRSLLSRLDRGT